MIRTDDDARVAWYRCRRCGFDQDKPRPCAKCGFDDDIPSFIVAGWTDKDVARADRPAELLNAAKAFMWAVRIGMVAISIAGLVASSRLRAFDRTILQDQRS